MHVDDAAALLSEKCLTERGLIRDLALVRVSLRRADEHEGVLIAELDVLDRDLAAHLDDVAGTSLDDVRVADLGREVLDLALEECLLILGIVVLRVLGEVAQCDGGLQALCNLDALDALEVVELFYEIIYADDTFKCPLPAMKKRL